MKDEAISPSEVSKEDIKKARKEIEATESILRMVNPRLFEDLQKQPSVQKRTTNEQVSIEPLVYLESKGNVNKMLLNEFLERYGMTPGDLMYYSSKPKALFEYIKRNNPTIDGLKIPSSGIFYTTK